ncbi:hypothetical protein BJY52DRAFT_1195828 [Lactarius psammicola]|nr:hypothetical protein BJY52DRAFT_1195828 [Lactarius psammicola]
MLAALGVNTSAPVSVTQTLVDCSKEDVQRKLQKRKQYEPNMLEGPLNENEPAIVLQVVSYRPNASSYPTIAGV